MSKKTGFVTKITELKRESMKKVLTLSDIFAIGYGDLGSSIYYALGVTALYALGATPLALGIAGFVFICTALTYAEMSSMRVAAGGSSSFTRYAINDFFSFVAGWALLLDFIVTIAISAYSAVPYLSYFFPLLKVTPVKIGVTVFIISVLFLLNFFGAKQSTRISWILTAGTIITQIVILLFAGYWFFDMQILFEHFKIGGADAAWSPSWMNFMKGTAMAMVAYTGIESMAQLTSETKTPSKTVPRAIMIVAGILILMYWLISSVALCAITPEKLGKEFLEDPIAGIVSALPAGKQLLGSWVGILGAILLIVAANAGIIGASRVAFRMGEYHQLPRGLYRLHSKYKTPVISLLCFAGFASMIVVWSRGNLDFLVDLYNFGAALAFTMAHLSLIILRVKQPHAERPFKVPFSIPIGKGIRIPILAVIGCIATFGVWLSVIVLKPQGRYLGCLWLVFGTIIYLVYRKRSGFSSISTLQIEQVDIPEYQPLVFNNILVAIKPGLELETVEIAADLAKHYQANLTAVCIIEVPLTMPIESPLHYKLRETETCMKRAQAIAREQKIDLQSRVVRARTVSKAIKEIAIEEQSDLIVLGSPLPKKGGFFGSSHSSNLDEIIKIAPCRVFVAYGTRVLSLDINGSSQNALE